ncbi:MAG: DUF4065 domain-containing protein [Alphaproteobacteria bacterium]|nr:MAG: DUF4065 domain-containing protein [Alphaproteobacteria bacterium]
MATLKDTVAYILKEYPHKDELSNARVTKLVYLSDWRQSITKGEQITGINWYFDNFGPFVWDVKNTVNDDAETFSVEHSLNLFGAPKTLFKLKDKKFEPDLSDEEKASIKHAIEQTKALSWDSFISLVYSTYPIMSSDRYSSLDLPELAKEYVQAEEGIEAQAAV